MNPMFLSFLNSMQTKSQDAQNPGLWVNGNRMPMQEELARKLDPSASSFFKPKSGQNNYLQLVAPPVDADGNREVTPEEAARSAALSAEIDASVRADAVRAQLQDRDKVVTDTRNPLEYAKEPTYDELDQRAEAIKRRRGQGLPVYSPDSAYKQDQNAAKAVVAGLQENTNRSMFLTHLQSMQTKSQNAQNPGLWVNGNRMPVQESLLGAAVRGIGQVAKFGYDLGNNLGNGMMNTANTAVTGSPLKPYPQPSLLPPAPLQPSIRPPRFDPPGRRPPSPGLRPFDPQNSGIVRPYPPGPGEDGGDADFIKPRPSPRPDDRYVPRIGPGGREPSRLPRRPGSIPDWAPDYPYPNPSPRPSYIPKLPGLINPKPKSPTEITVDDIINPNTGNVSLSTGEANKPGAVTLHPEGQNILNPPAKPKIDFSKFIRHPGTYGGGERQPDLDVIGGPDDPYAPGGSKSYDVEKLIKQRAERRPDYITKAAGDSLIPQDNRKLMNRMY